MTAIPQGHLTQHFYSVTGCNVSTTLKIHTALPSEIIETFFRSQTLFIFSANPEQRLQYYLLDAYLFQLSFIQADISGSGQNVQRLPQHHGLNTQAQSCHSTSPTRNTCSDHQSLYFMYLSTNSNTRFQNPLDHLISTSTHLYLPFRQFQLMLFIWILLGFILY